MPPPHGENFPSESIPATPADAADPLISERYRGTAPLDVHEESAETRDPDGSTLSVRSTTHTYPDGTKRVVSVDADGFISESVTAPGGSTATIRVAGPDGEVVTINSGESPGSATLSRPDGSALEATLLRQEDGDGIEGLRIGSTGDGGTASIDVEGNLSYSQGLGSVAGMR